MTRFLVHNSTGDVCCATDRIEDLCINCLETVINDREANMMLRPPTMNYRELCAEQRGLDAPVRNSAPADRRVPAGALPLPATIELIANERRVEMQEDAEARAASARKRTVKDASGDGYNDDAAFDDRTQPGSVPPRGVPNLDPHGDDGRVLVGESEDPDDADAENNRRLHEGTIYGRGSLKFNCFSGGQM